MTIPHAKGSKTSQDAAVSMQSSLGKLQSEVYQLVCSLGSKGATCEEIETSLGMKHQTASARVLELYNKGLLHKTTTRPTRSGRLATVYVSARLHNAAGVGGVLKGPPMMSFTGVKGGKYYLVQTVPQFREMMALAMQQPVLAVDTETSGLSLVKADACGVVLGWGVAHNYYIPIDHKTDEKQLSIDLIRPALCELLENPSTTKVFWNAKFDLHFLRKLGVEVKGVIHDGVIMCHLLDENEEKGLKPNSVKYIDSKADCWEYAITKWRSDEAKRRRSAFSEIIKAKQEEMRPEFEAAYPMIQHSGLKKGQITSRLKNYVKDQLKDHPLAKNKKDDVTYDYIPLELMTPYAAADVHYTFLLYKKFLLLVSQHDQLKKLYINEMKLSNLLFEVESRGALIDVEYLKELVPKLEQEVDECAEAVYEAVGYKFNIDSTKGLTQALLDAGVTLTKLTKTSLKKRKEDPSAPAVYSVDSDVIEALAASLEFPAKIKTYRETRKLKNTYAINIINMVDENNYLHFTLNQNVSTGRMSSSSPCCQNIPGRNTSIRRAFICPDQEDFVFVFIDYSQVELRLTAHHSQDPALLDCYPHRGEGVDVHSLTCAEVIMDVPYRDLLEMKGDKTGHDDDDDACDCPACTVKFKRNIAKRVNFGIIYGAGDSAIQRQVSTPFRYVSKDDCRMYIDKYFDKYRGVKRWIDRTELSAARSGYAQNTFGRYRRLPKVKSFKQWERERAARQSVNFMIQGDAADIFKVASVRVSDFLRSQNAKTRIVNFVHDEIQFYWHKSELHLLPKVKSIMEDFPQFSVPLIAEISYSKTDWANKKELS